MPTWQTLAINSKKVKTIVTCSINNFFNLLVLNRTKKSREMRTFLGNLESSLFFNGEVSFFTRPYSISLSLSLCFFLSHSRSQVRTLTHTNTHTHCRSLLRTQSLSHTHLHTQYYTCLCCCCIRDTHTWTKVENALK